MAEQPITLSRAEVKELWDFMTRVDMTMKRVDGMLDNHEVRLCAVEQKQAAQGGASDFSRYIWPVLLSAGALIMSMLAFLKRAL